MSRNKTPEERQALAEQKMNEAAKLAYAKKRAALAESVLSDILKNRSTDLEFDNAEKIVKLTFEITDKFMEKVFKQ